MIRCREWVELVTEYLEAALPAAEHERVAAHLRECDGCTAYLRQFRAVIALAARAGESSHERGSS